MKCLWGFFGSFILDLTKKKTKNNIIKIECALTFFTFLHFFVGFSLRDKNVLRISKNVYNKVSPKRRFPIEIRYVSKDQNIFRDTVFTMKKK